LVPEWVLVKGEDFGPYSRNEAKEYLAENAAAAEITHTPDEVEQPEHAAAHMTAIDR
jgi:hypothetical protein